MNKETPREAVKNVLERMREGGLWQPKGLGLSYVKSGGQTVIISSIQSKFGVPAHSAYGASKHAIEGLVDSLRFELADSGINFMVVYPHWIHGTGMRENALGPDGEAVGDRKRSHSNSSSPLAEL